MVMSDAATAAAIVKCLAAILADFGVFDLAQLQRTVRDSPVAGMYLDFELHDGSYVGQNDRRVLLQHANFIHLVRYVRIGATVAGNDSVEVAPQRIDLLEFATLHTDDFATQAADRVRQLMGEVEEAATDLWNETTGDSE
jgi:hypothetical protein